MIRIGSIYSGVGGLDLAILAATEPRGRIVWHCENAAYPRAVLAERFQGVPCYESDEAIDETAPAIDVLIGGPPCQPASTAGKRKGAEDERWRWPHFLRIVRVLRPSVVYVENPQGDQQGADESLPILLGRGHLYRLSGVCGGLRAASDLRVPTTSGSVCVVIRCKRALNGARRQG